MKDKEGLTEPQKQYLKNYFQIFVLFVILLVGLPHILAHQPDESSRRVTSLDYLAAYSFLSGCCVLYTFHTIAREFSRSNLKRSITIKLTKSFLGQVTPKEIIYAEVAGGAAMGNEGGIIMYLIEDGVLTRYETNVFTDEEVYLLAEDLMSSQVGFGLFRKIYGGMGNYVFVNKDISLEIRSGYFVYKKGSEEYQILPSALGVFENVADALINNRKEYI